jgi:hypothetical protein
MKKIAWLLLAACATTGEPGEGDRDLPTAGVGPFRKLAPEEVKGIAPFVLEDPNALYREPAVLREGEATLLYAVARDGGRDVIVRTRALDERTFFGSTGHLGNKPATVLAPEAPWEIALSGPWVLRWRGELLLYYGGAEGIGLARSSDGFSFRKEPAPVLVRGGDWETAPPHAPSVFELPDGRLHMLYAAGNAIGEAESDDGTMWRRLPGPVLAPGGQPFDAIAVGDPCAVPRTTPAGRFHVRVLYTGMDVAGKTTIGFAARYGEAGPLEGQAAPVYSVGQNERAPALLDLGPTSFLYVQQSRAIGSKPPYAAIAAGFAPANVTLPLAGDYPVLP